MKKILSILNISVLILIIGCADENAPNSDNDNRITSHKIFIQGGTITEYFNYNSKGLLTQLDSNWGSLAIEYGSNNRPSKIKYVDLYDVEKNWSCDVVWNSNKSFTYKNVRGISIGYAGNTYILNENNRIQENYSSYNPDEVVRFTYDSMGNVDIENVNKINNEITNTRNAVIEFSNIKNPYAHIDISIQIAYRLVPDGLPQEWCPVMEDFAISKYVREDGRTITFEHEKNENNMPIETVIKFSSSPDRYYGYSYFYE